MKIVIVGSGVGGATVAKELSGKGKEVIILEKADGKNWGPKKNALDFGTEQFPANVSKEGIVVYRTLLMVGGAGVVSMGNAVRTLENELHSLGINLEQEFHEIEKELNISPVPPTHMGARTKAIVNAAEELGYHMVPMPKYINFKKCRCCGMCLTGCPYGAKWTPVQFLNEAKTKGAILQTGMHVEEIIHSSGKVKSVKGHGINGSFEISADMVILAAGGIGTPIILKKSGLQDAGNNLFVDLYVNTFGTMRGINMKDEMPMAAVLTSFRNSNGFVMAPYMNYYPSGSYITCRPPICKSIKFIRLDQTFGIMTKIKDDGSGKVNIDSSIEKRVTEKDKNKLDQGISIAKEILIKAGCDPKTLFTDQPQGAHPGGTAAIGRIVNADLETEIKGLYVSDASVLPEAPGAPPIMTIIALSKMLAKKIIG